MPVKKSLKELLGAIESFMECSLVGDGELEVTDVCPIEDGVPDKITFLASPKYAKYLKDTKAGAIVLSSKTPKEELREEVTYILCSNPYLAFALILNELRPYFMPEKGVDERAAIAKSASIGKDVTIQATVFIEEDAVIGDGAVIFAGAYIGKGVKIGEGTVVYPNASLREGTIVGKNVIINCNAAIGTEGYGYANNGAKYVKVPQTGIVVIEDDCEIGAGCMIDRAAMEKTIIRRGTKLDNLCHIAHNADIGEDSLLLGQIGVSGSTKVGKRNIMAGQSGMVGHIQTTDDVTLGARSAFTKTITKPGVYSGFPAIPHGDWLKAQTIAKKLPDVRKRLAELEKRIKELEEKK